MSRNAASSRSAAGARAAAPGSQNLLKQSQTYGSSPWSLLNLTVTPAATTGPTGLLDGTALIATGTSSVQHVVYQSESTLALPGQPYTLAWYAKAGAVSYCALLLDGTFAVACYTLTGAGSCTGVGGVEVVSAPSIQAVGGGWYLCAATMTPRNHTAGASGIYPASAQSYAATTYAAADTTSAQIYVQGAWAAQCNAVTPYVQTTSAVVNTGAPRSVAGARSAA